LPTTLESDRHKLSFAQQNWEETAISSSVLGYSGK